MDMSAGFVAATRVQSAALAAIVHDKFHVAKLPNDASSTRLRRAEHQQPQGAEGDDTLKHTRYLWLHSQLPEAKQADFADLPEINPKTAMGLGLLSEQRLSSSGPSRTRPKGVWTSSANGSAPCMRSRLTKVKRRRQDPFHVHLVHLLTYFLHPITNAVSEGFNSRIQAIKADARGFRCFENYRARILFHCGKLSLMPDIP